MKDENSGSSPFTESSKKPAGSIAGSPPRERERSEYGRDRRRTRWRVLSAAGSGAGLPVPGIGIAGWRTEFSGDSIDNGAAGSNPQQAEPDPNAQAALAQAAAPLLDAVNKNPNDYDSLIKLRKLFYDGKQFPSAIQYYERALALHPENPDVRTDMGTATGTTGMPTKRLPNCRLR